MIKTGIRFAASTIGILTCASFLTCVTGSTIALSRTSDHIQEKVSSLRKTNNDGPTERRTQKVSPRRLGKGLLDVPNHSSEDNNEPISGNSSDEGSDASSSNNSNGGSGGSKNGEKTYNADENDSDQSNFVPFLGGSAVLIGFAYFYLRRPQMKIDSNENLLIGEHVSSSMEMTPQLQRNAKQIDLEVNTARSDEDSVLTYSTAVSILKPSKYTTTIKPMTETAESHINPTWEEPLTPCDASVMSEQQSVTSEQESVMSEACSVRSDQQVGLVQQESVMSDADSVASEEPEQRSHNSTQNLDAVVFHEYETPKYFD